MLDTKKIDKFRKIKDLTIPQLSELLCINKGTYHNLRNSGDFRVSQLEKMAEIFEVDICEFFTSGSVNKQGDYNINIKANKVSENTVNYGLSNENKALKEKIELLEKAIKDKEIIIELLTKGK